MAQRWAVACEMEERPRVHFEKPPIKHVLGFRKIVLVS